MNPAEGGPVLNETAAPVQISDLGTPVDKVILDIDYQIIEHFSRHLYGSANKAIEELVANGFDAYAERVFVYLPGAFTTEYVVVWDDGWSMGVEALKSLWLIAASPKEVMGRVAKGSRGPRNMIGKFGIGKLASYTIGNVITHVCRMDDSFLSVSVDYRRVHPEEAEDRVTTKNPLTAPIRSLSAEQAFSLFKTVFDTGKESEALKRFEERTWTLAVVGDLKGKEIQRGRLAWVLGNGMPLRPDFQVWINDEEVESKLEKDCLVEWDMSEPGLISSLETSWAKAVEKGDVSGSVETGREAGLDPRRFNEEIPYIYLPHSGWVWGAVRLFEKSLLDSRSVDHGRSHGFFILVRGRLLNADDAEIFLKPPSFGTFYRSQFILNIDGLDEDLLADRDRLRQDSERSGELAVLQQAFYIAARAYLDNRDNEAAEKAKILAALPVRSREYYREPLMALLAQSTTATSADFHIAKPRVERSVLGEDEPMAAISGEGFLVNASHPYFKLLESRLGSSKKAQELYRVYDMFAVSELLLEGHLYDVGLSKEQVHEVVKWREGLFRELAKSYGSAPSDLAIELINSSYVGGRSFEDALAAVLESMGFVARRRGQAGKEDVYIHATIGPSAYSLIFEAKGSKTKIANDKAEVSGAAAHREKAKAEWAVIVAREFAGFEGRSDAEPAVIAECMATNKVSIMTVESLIELSSVVAEFGYPLDVLKEVFTKVETPSEKFARIQALKSPARDFDYRRLLDAVWEEQQTAAEGDYVTYRRIWQVGWRGEIEFPDFERRVIALETLAGGRIRVLIGPQTMYMLQTPEIVTEAIESSLYGRGSVHHGDGKDGE